VDRVIPTIPQPFSRDRFALGASFPLFGRVCAMNVEFIQFVDHTRHVPRLIVAPNGLTRFAIFSIHLFCVALVNCSDMALVDFYQLSVLYKLRRPNADFTPVRSHCLPMSASTPPPSPSPPVEPDQVHPSLPPSVLPEFKTPERRCSGSRPMPNITPLSRGSSMCQKQEGDTDRIEGYGREDYEEYIREDLQSRIFVDFEVFMKSVLHAPDDWRTRWGPTIEAVKTDKTFKKHHKKYIECCARSGSPEKTFYGPLMNTANAVLNVLSGSGLDGISSKDSQYYHINDPKRLRGGVINKANLSPDLVVLHTDCRLSAGEGGLHWANPLHILEVKPHGSALCDGNNMPRLVVDGKHATCSSRV